VHRIEISPAAAADLEAIWLYGFEQWDETQADEYYDALMVGIEQLRSNPLLGKSEERVRKDYRSIHLNRHVVFYRVLNDAVDIVRVLHDRMVPDNYL